MYVRPGIIFNPDDGKQPKTFGSNILIFEPFQNLFSLVYIIYVIEIVGDYAIWVTIPE